MKPGYRNVLRHSRAPAMSPSVPHRWISFVKVGDDQASTLMRRDYRPPCVMPEMI